MDEDMPLISFFHINTSDCSLLFRSVNENVTEEAQFYQLHVWLKSKNQTTAKF